jgi:ribonucleoside-triphosphate reductase (thioredoxin)
MSKVKGSGLMAAYNFKEKYARYNGEESRREEWPESVRRMFYMHDNAYAHLLSPEDLAEVSDAEDSVRAKLLLGSQRALQFGGKGVEAHNMRIYNCAVSYCDRPRFFAEAFYMLLCGCGVGFSVQQHHVAQLPKFRTHPTQISKVVTIKDSIEGWADALDYLVSYYLQLAPIDHAQEIFAKPEFDYSEIRDRGAKLSVGGTAPGPEPLRRALEKIKAIFERAIANGQAELRSVDAYDIVMHASDAVLSGGVRRSASIALFSPDDELMAGAKTGNWFIDNPQRGRSNNSAVLVRGVDNLENFKRLMRSVREFGEPGFIFVESLEYIYNPCVEVGMCPVLILDPNGDVVEQYTLDLLNFTKRNEWTAEGYTFRSGWQCCNLTEMNASAWTSQHDAYKCARHAAIIGTLQAGYTDPGYLTATSQLIIERESLLGVSMTGMMDNTTLSLDPIVLRRMAEIVRETNAEWAAKIGINPAARTTCVKPAGNSSVLLSERFFVASGCHAHHAKRMIRRVQAHKDGPILQWFKEHNPHMIEESVWSANKTDDVISFPIEIQEGALTKDHFTAIQFLSTVALIQKNWVIPGTARPMSCEGLTHNVSNTCTVQPDEWGDVGRYIYENKKLFSGLSLLSSSGDFIYRQAPMQRIVFEDELAEQFGRSNVGAAKHLKRHIERRYGSLHDVMMPLKMVLEGYTTEEAIEGTKVHPELLWDTYKRIRAVIHVEDTDDILFLLSAIGHEELWKSLTENMVDVDYSQLYEGEDLTKLADNIACGGGSCELDFSIPKE